jgi:hypothetical protein
MTGERFMLVIAAVPSRHTATQRLKCLLKCLLRSHGFRCVELRPAMQDESKPESEATTTISSASS